MVAEVVVYYGAGGIAVVGTGGESAILIRENWGQLFSNSGLSVVTQPS